MQMVNQNPTVVINGHAQPYVACAIPALLEANAIDPTMPGIAVALNGTVIPRSSWGTTVLQPGDHVEIVQAKAGG
ncbi:MAG: hypothetical protein NVS2B7_33350 [Herpetosiphon sp.]